MSVDDVCQWLESVKLGHVVEAFRSNEIDGGVLAKIDKAGLAEIGISALNQSRVLSAVEKLLACELSLFSCVFDPVPCARSGTSCERGCPLAKRASGHRH